MAYYEYGQRKDRISCTVDCDVRQRLELFQKQMGMGDLSTACNWILKQALFKQEELVRRKAKEKASELAFLQDILAEMQDRVKKDQEMALNRPLTAFGDAP